MSNYDIINKIECLCNDLIDIKISISHDVKNIMYYDIDVKKLINNFLCEIEDVINDYNYILNNTDISKLYVYCKLFITTLIHDIELTDDPNDIIIPNDHNACVILDCDETLLDPNSSLIQIRPYVCELLQKLYNNNYYVLIWTAGSFLHICRCIIMLYLHLKNKLYINAILYRGSWFDNITKDVNIIPSIKHYIHINKLIQIDDAYEYITHDNNIIIPKYHYLQHFDIETNNKLLSYLADIIIYYFNNNKFPEKYNNLEINQKCISNIKFNYIIDTLNM